MSISNHKGACEHGGPFFQNNWQGLSEGILASEQVHCCNEDHNDDGDGDDEVYSLFRQVA